MNAFRKFTIFQKLSAYLKFAGRLSIPLIGIGLVDAGLVNFYVGYNWRFGESRIFPTAKWRGYTEEQVTSIIQKREPIISAVRDLFLLREGTAIDPEIAKLFTEDCVYEDPNIRIKSGKRILGMFKFQVGKLKSVEFKEFSPRHYEDKIVIEKKLAFVPDFVTIYPQSEVTYKGNIVIDLTPEGDGKATNEKIKYISDEWNCVSLVQPKTHNVYIFSGSMAKFLRTSQGLLSYYRHKDDKTILNPFLILDFKDKIARRLNDKRIRDLNPVEVKRHPETDPEGHLLFNASGMKEPRKESETVSNS